MSKARPIHFIPPLDSDALTNQIERGPLKEQRQTNFFDAFADLSDEKHQTSLPVTAQAVIATGDSSVTLTTRTHKSINGQQAKLYEGNTTDKVVPQLLTKHHI